MTSTSSDAMLDRDLQTRSMVTRTDAKVLSESLARDLEATRSSESITKNLEKEATLAILLVLSIFACILLFFVFL